jgi:hypothetical protein
MEATGSYWKAVWHILEGAFTLEDLTGEHFATLDREKQAHRLVLRLAQLGYRVELQGVAA